MGDQIFREGGPHKIKRVGHDEYSMTVTIPKDEDGRVARECPNDECSPGYFKVKLGTGILDKQDAAYCPYCRRSANPSEFTTREQVRYAKDLALKEAHEGVQSMLHKALGLGASGKRTLGGGMLSIEMSLKQSSSPPVRRPFEDEVRRDLRCPHCGLDHTVFGLATWCPDCGEDVFMTHVAAELAVTRVMLGDVGRRESTLGKRVAAKDLENCLEDTVSIFEAAVRAIVRRGMAERGMTRDEIGGRLKKFGNAFQSIPRTKDALTDLFGVRVEDAAVWSEVNHAFEKRHPIAHNLGVIDRKYLERARENEQEGREIRITANEIETLLSRVEDAVGQIRNAVLSHNEV